MIIALSGYARSGKDTIAAAFIAAHPEYRRVAFADTLRAVALKANPVIPYDTMNDYELDHDPLSKVISEYGWDGYKESPYADGVRAFLQRLGVAVREELGENAWVNAALVQATTADGLYALPENLIITDCRFRNEAQAVKDRGGIVVRVTRPGVGPANDHISEHDLDDYPFDIIINNEDTPEDAARFLWSVVFELHGRQ
jgi:hypothetical protein